MNLEFTPAALSDIRSIRDYTLEKWGSDQEKIYLNSLWQKFEEIRLNPGKWRFREDLFPRCQIASEGRHVILFRINEDTLQIVRVLHSTMELLRHVPKNLS